MLRFITIGKASHSVTKRVILAAAILGLLVFGTVSPSWAFLDFNAYLPIAGTPITPSFKFAKTLQFDYSNGGKLKDALSGKNLTISFSDDSTNNPSIKSLMEQINTNIATDQKSVVTFSNLKLNYQVVISGGNNLASVDYLVTLTPTLTGYIINKDSQNTVFDIAWIGFNMEQPATITTTQYGNLEINYPLDVLKSQVPDAYNIIKGTDAEKALSNQVILDASTLLKQPIDKWDTLFDPSYIVTDAVGLGFSGQKVAVTTFASGASGVQQGSLKQQNIDIDFTADAKYHLSTVERASSGTINADGHANAYLVQGEPAISTSVQASTTTGTATAGGLSTMTIYAMAAFAAVIAGGIFFWSNRKMKQALNRVQEPSRPIEYETRQHWADRFDGQPSGSSNQPTRSDDKTKRSAI